MRGGAVVLAAVLSLTGTGTAAQTVEQVVQRRASGQASWDWSGERPAGTFTASFVRANVRIVRADIAQVEVHATAPDPDGNGSAVTLDLSRDGNALRIVDRYPATPPFAFNECLPPDREHGGAWVYGEKLEVTLIVPRDLNVSATTTAGSIYGR